VGFRNRLAVLWSWSWSYLRKDRPIRIIARSDPDTLTGGVEAHEHHVSRDSAAQRRGTPWQQVTCNSGDLPRISRCPSAFTTCRNQGMHEPS
jgi:hypothetical protein